MANRQGGNLDRRIQIQRATVAPSPYNEPIETWLTVSELWAGVKDVSAGEAYKAAEVDAEISTRFTVRFSHFANGINPKDRVVWDGKTYNITAVRRVQNRDSYIEIDAVARADQPNL